jgi:hypothetical protein
VPITVLDLREQTIPIQKPRHDSALFRIVVCTALYAIPLVTALQPISELDTWWHLRTGQWIVEHGGLPATDPFSSFGMGKAWIAYSWLFGLLLYALHHSAGLFGIILYRVVLDLAIVAALHRLIARRERRFGVAAALVACATVAMTPLLLGERPGLFTILFATLTLDAVLTLRAGGRSKTLWLLPFCYVVWANIHIQFVHGLFILGLACAAPLADRLLGLGEPSNDAKTWGSRGWWMLVLLTGACFLATLVNPYHVRLYTQILEYGRQTETYRLFPELHAPDFREVSDWVLLGVAGAAAFALGRRRTHSAFDFLLLAAGAYFAFHAKHDLWFVVVAACAVIVAPRPASAAERQPTPVWTWPQLLLAGATLALLFFVVARGRDLSETTLEAKVAAEFPVKAAAFVEEQRLTGPLYNHVDWGGFLIWRLPEYPVAIDGRSNLHGDQRMKRFADTWEGRPGWDADPDLAAAGVVLLQTRAPLTALLQRSGRFEVVYQDEIATVFVPRGTTNAL